LRARAELFAWTLVLVALLYGLESLIVVVEGKGAAMAGLASINVRDLRKVFKPASGSADVIAIDRLDFEIRQGRDCCDCRHDGLRKIDLSRSVDRSGKCD
jgi:hypothetical protein